MITTKFNLATVQGIDIIEKLATRIANEKFSGILAQATLASYLSEHLNRKTLFSETNSLSNQWLIVYVNDEPAGYACITSKGKRPDTIQDKRAIRIADFGVLKQYSSDAQVSLLQKCLSICNRYPAIWVNEFTENPLIDFFKNNGFAAQEQTAQLDELPLSSIYLVRKGTE